MSFLVPAFLFGMAALAVPILVHLRHRQRKTAVPFPSLMFLRRIDFREVRRQQIHHWPLFFLRALAVALLVFAFARPFFRDRDLGSAVAGAGGRDLVVLLDRSASMGYGDRWARAQAMARDVINGMTGRDRAAVVLFDATATIAVEPTVDRAILLTTIDGARPGAGSTRYGSALRAAREIAFGADRPGREVIMVSDFQRAGWTGEDIPALPEGTLFRPLSLAGGTADVTVGHVEITAQAQGGRMVGTVSAQLLATDLAAPRPVHATLEVGGRFAGERQVEVPTQGAAGVRFPSISLTDVPQRATIRLASADSLPADDEFHFLAFAERPLRVILRLPAGANPARSFFRQALAISRQPQVEVTVRSAPIGANDLRRADMVLLEDLAYPAGAEGRRLTAFVQTGGGLLHVVSDRTGGGWPADLISAQLGDVVDRSAGRPATIGLIRRDHPIFEPFRLPRSGDFSATRIYRYRSVRSDTMDVLVQYDDGAAALLSGTSGDGRLLIWSSAVDNVWSDLPLQPVFLPLTHQLVRYAAGYIDRPIFHRVGEVASFETGTDEAVVLVSPAGERRRFEAGPDPVSFTVGEQGFYELREARVGGRLLASVASNLALDESNLTPLDPADLAVAVGAPDSVRDAPQVSGTDATAREREREQSLWWYVLAAVAVALLAEPLLANRLTGAVPTGVVVSGEG